MRENAFTSADVSPPTWPAPAVAGEQPERDIEADLVVDVAGRASRML